MLPRVDDVKILLNDSLAAFKASSCGLRSQGAVFEIECRFKGRNGANLDPDMYEKLMKWAHRHGEPCRRNPIECVDEYHEYGVRVSKNNIGETMSCEVKNNLGFMKTNKSLVGTKISCSSECPFNDKTLTSCKFKRRKYRNSFYLNHKDGKPLWRLDFTEVIKENNGKKNKTFEVELEFINSFLPPIEQWRDVEVAFIARSMVHKILVFSRFLLSPP